LAITFLTWQAAHEAFKIKEEKETIEQRIRFPGGRIMFVCDVCGVFINNTDNEARRLMTTKTRKKEYGTNFEVKF